MRIQMWEDLAECREQIKENIGVTIGVFDGIHIGHQQLMNSIKGTDIVPTIITFTKNPAIVLKNRSFPGNILSLEQKLTKLKLFGIRLVILIDFSHDFSKISGKEFWFSLFRCLHVKKIALGHNFRFGHKRESNSDTLKAIATSGMTIDVIEPVFYKGKVVSSTRIRTLIQNGKFDDVQAMMGTRYCLDLKDIRIRELKGDVFGIPVKEIDQVLPEKGNYSVLLETDTGTVSSHIMIENTIIRIEKEADYTDIKNILFIKRS